MSALVWEIKRSLVDYVRSMPDGEITIGGGAELSPDGVFVFPGVADLRFVGTVTLVGHGGMMRVVIADPEVQRSGIGWVLTIVDPDDATARLPFATIDAFDPDDANGCRGVGAALTADGADLFFGPYVAGTPVEAPTITR